MIALIQRVRSASVTVEAVTVATIDAGLLALIGVEKEDSVAQAQGLADKLLAYRVFADRQGRMNLDVRTVEGSILLVPQFTLLADTHKGLRPSFSRGADPASGRELFESLAEEIKLRWEKVATGIFGANMQVSLVNDGPVTFWLQV